MTVGNISLKSTSALPPKVVEPQKKGSLPHEKKQASILGTGFFFGESGYVLTNYHVVRGANSIRIKCRNGEKISVRLIAHDSVNDIAILQPDRFPKMRPIKILIGNSSKVRLGDRVFTLGYPIANILGENLKYSEGAVSSLSGVGDDPRVFQVSVPIQAGNSGGPLFNERGEVVGIVSSSLDSRNTQAVIGNAPQNVNFACKSLLIQNLLPSLPKTLISPRDLSLDAVDPPGGSPRSLSDFVERVKDNIVLIHAK